LRRVVVVAVAAAAVAAWNAVAAILGAVAGALAVEVR
jgi:hypothetical protein